VDPNDRTDMIDTTARMAWLADRSNWIALIDVFTANVRVDHSSLLGGHDEHRLRRTNAGWRIADVTMTADWATGNQHIMHLAAKSSHG